MRACMYAPTLGDVLGVASGAYHMLIQSSEICRDELDYRVCFSELCLLKREIEEHFSLQSVHPGDILLYNTYKSEY